MLTFLSSPTITFTYYLFTLIGIEAALSIAWGQWQRSSSFRARRLVIAFAGLTILRVMLLLLTFAGTSSPEITTMWLPPFERAVAISSVSFLVWGFTPFFREREFIGNILLVINSTLAFIFFLLAVFFWQGDNFNNSLWEIFFVTWQVAIVLFGGINCGMKLDDERTYALLSFVTLLVGYGLHLFLAGSYSVAHIPFLIHLAEMIAYPLFAIAIYQSAIQSLSVRSQELQNLSEISLDQIKGLISLFEASRQITASLDLPTVLDGAAESVATAIGADQCAIALPEDNKDISQLRLVSIYNPSRKGRGEAVTFPLNDQQVIKHALKRKYQIQIDEYQDNRQIQFLFILMGASDVGPLLIQPLLKENEPIGVLILGNSISKQVFTKGETQLSKVLADQITVSIGHSREYMNISSKSKQLAWTLRNQELESGKRRAAMETELKKSREEVALFAQRLYEYETAEQANKEKLEQAQGKVVKLEKTAEQARQEVEKAIEKDKRITADTKKYKTQLSELETEQKELLDKIELLNQNSADINRLNEALASSNKRGRKLARALKSARIRIQQVAPVPAALSSAEANAQLEDLSCGVIIGDAKDKINRVNAVASNLLLQSSNKLIGSKLSDVFPDDEQWQKALQQLKTGREPMVTTTLKFDKNVLRVTISPMSSSEDNSREGTVTILYDITSEIESQQARDEFIASLSQELRTPMTSITGYTDLLLGESVGVIGKMQRKFLQRVKANIERMGSMLADLIGVTAIDAGQLEIRPTVVDIVEIIEDTIISAKAQLEENEILLKMNLLDDMPAIEADPDSVRQIMGNLLNNAIRCTRTGKSIEISTSYYENEETNSNEEGTPFLQISVADSGGGISEKDIERVFNRFYQAEQPLIEGLGETGVGLSIVKSLTDANGGRVWVKSEIGDGSVFYLILPISNQFDDPWQEVDIPPLDLNTNQF